MRVWVSLCHCLICVRACLCLILSLFFKKFKFISLLDLKKLTFICFLAKAFRFNLFEHNYICLRMKVFALLQGDLGIFFGLSFVVFFLVSFNFISSQKKPRDAQYRLVAFHVINKLF